MTPIFDYFGIRIKNEKDKKRSVNLKDEYIVIGSLLLFLLLLIYINHEQTWDFWHLATLFTIVFLGTIALGSISQGQKIGLITWVILAVPTSIGFVLYFQISEIVVLGIISAFVIHGFLGAWKLLKI